MRDESTNGAQRSAPSFPGHRAGRFSPEPEPESAQPAVRRRTFQRMSADRASQHRGRLAASGSAPFASKWVRIFAMTSGFSMHIWTHPVLQDTCSFETRRRLLPYIRPVIANVLSLALMNSARPDLNKQSASIEPVHRADSQDDGLTCLVINR